MINDSINKLQSQISNLESKLEKLEKNSINQINNLGFSVWTKNLLNFNISDKRKFHIATINNIEKRNLFFQLRTSFINFSNQKIQFDLYCDNIKISSETQTFDNQSYEISLNGVYQNLVSDKIDIYLTINPKHKKQLSVISSILTVWGATQDQYEEYDAIESETDYCLSYISNNNLYYKIFNKNTDESEIDFILAGEYISHSICKDNNNNIFLFKVDIDGNLFFENLQTKEEFFISSNTNKVSSSFQNNSIYFCYISNNDCYFGEVLNNVVISNNKITSLHGIFIDCYLYANTFLNKCYIILSKKDGSNYLLESIPENFKAGENIIANIDLHISTKEGE